MVDAAQTFELFRFADTTQSVAVEVSCGAPLTVDEKRYYPAEIVVTSDFVSGRVGLQVSLEDLDEWERCLDALQSEQGAEWPAGGRSAWVDVVPDDPVEVSVHDSPSTQVSVRVPVDVTPAWLEDNRRRLDHVRAAVTTPS
ncbi:hypothetical protein CIB93_30570 [Streptomyces sp. WZ.A104]|uniref:DUF5959 family protein n=1 Tax=Streptomyces sp. WZ.A104 TaxID=2023771 RepID=UPI000BBBE3A2|nr:DUF5959 family protein [Streptomyces sp. WZ.A104]PCG82319.1 hypothetical protein CIB93_30570 [Streptomyces sp. WZ.A104]